MHTKAKQNPYQICIKMVGIIHILNYLIYFVYSRVFCCLSMARTDSWVCLKKYKTMCNRGRFGLVFSYVVFDNILMICILLQRVHSYGPQLSQINQNVCKYAYVETTEKNDSILHIYTRVAVCDLSYTTRRLTVINI